jgi:hypothetical protein
MQSVSVEDDQLVRVYRPEAKWMIAVAAKRLRAGHPLRERIFQEILENGRGTTLLPLSEARRLRV